MSESVIMFQKMGSHVTKWLYANFEPLLRKKIGANNLRAALTYAKGLRRNVKSLIQRQHLPKSLTMKQVPYLLNTF